MKLLVAIHDVSPAYSEDLRVLWDLCRERNVTPALLVVPNWHGKWPLERSPDFVDWIHQRVADGAEVFLHGERHDEVGSARTLTDHLRALGRTDAEAEFLALSDAEIRERVTRGLRVLAACGLRPVGFIPPAWLARPGWSSQMVKFGFRIGEDVRHVYLHERAMRIEAPVIRWSARTPLRAGLSTRLASERRRWDRRAPLMRIALHPQDLASTHVRGSISHTLDGWLESHHPFQYSQL